MPSQHPLETPIIIGLSDIKNNHPTTPSTLPTHTKEPLDLIHSAILGAIADATAQDAEAGEKLKAQIDSIDVVRTWTWPYEDLPGLLGGRLGVVQGDGKEKDGKVHLKYSEHGGDKPGVLLDDAARRLARGEARVAVVCGGEALGSCKFCLVSICVMSNLEGHSHVLRCKMREGSSSVR